MKSDVAVTLWASYLAMLAALATMQREFLLAPTVMQWVDNDLVASTACIILGGSLGRRRPVDPPGET